MSQWPQTLTNKVVEELVARYNRKTIPAIEEIQDMVETVLIKSGHAKTAKAYIALSRTT